MPELKRPLRVFLSYASQDKFLVRELSRRLVGEGWIDTWQDEKSLLPGQDWRAKIEEAVEDADVVIICLSNHSVTKEGHVQKELRYAREIALEKPEDAIFLIPLRLEVCEVPRGLRFYQWVDYFGDIKDSSYRALVASLNLRYEQKLRTEEAERLRKELQQREIAEKNSREKAEKARLKAEEERQRIAKSKAEQEVAERVEQKRKEKELREKSAREEKEGGQKSVPTKPQIGMKSVYWFGGFAVIVLGIVLFSSQNNLSQSVEPTPVNTPSQIAATTIPTKSLDFVATLTPYPTETPAPTSTFTLTPLPVKIIDIKNVPMALVSSGNFIMGSESGNNDAKHVHEVYLDDFYMDIYEVTNKFYEECVGEGVCSEPVYWDYYREKFYADHPVVYVTWTQADVYCKWRGASLPTEAQWEKAARGVDGRTYPWGEEIDCSKASFRSCNKTDTDEVGSYESGKSPYGIYDMAGNVWEWTADWYEENYYQYSLLSNPSGPETGIYRVMRGGAWSYQVDYLRSYNRRSGNVDGARNVIGFRCVRNIP